MTNHKVTTAQLSDPSYVEAMLDAILCEVDDDVDLVDDLETLADDSEEVGSRLDSFCVEFDGEAPSDAVRLVREAAAARLTAL